MSLSNKGLGRGLNALFNPLPTESANMDKDTLDLDLLEPNPKQPRSSFSEDSLRELAESIRQQGILQPILVRPIAGGRYQIIAGERRWRAAKAAGLTEAPVIIKNADDNEVMILALIENIQREDLNPLERARGLNSLKDMLGVSQEELADRVGQSRGSISNTLRLVNLFPQAQEALRKGDISMGHARCLLSLPSEDLSDQLLQAILDKDLTVRQTEQIVAHWHEEGRFPWEKAATLEDVKNPKNPEIARLAQEIGAALHCEAKIRGTVDKGKISIAYNSNEELFELLEKFGLSLNSGQ